MENEQKICETNPSSHVMVSTEKEKKRTNLYSNEVHLVLQCVHTYS